jgi:hypothetical protein
MSTKPPKYSIGTIAACGPDDTLATMLVVAIFRDDTERADLLSGFGRSSRAAIRGGDREGSTHRSRFDA